VELEETGKFEFDWKEWTNQIEALKLDIARVDIGLASQEEAPKVSLIKSYVGQDELKTNQKGATGYERDSNSFTGYGVVPKSHLWKNYAACLLQGYDERECRASLL